MHLKKSTDQQIEKIIKLMICMSKANKNCALFSTQQFTCQKIISENDKVFI